MIQEACPTELQAPELEPCGVIKEAEQLLTQEEFTLTPIQPSQPLKPQKAPQKNLLFASLHPIEPSPIYRPSSLTLFYQTHDHALPPKMSYGLSPQRTTLHKIDPFTRRAKTF